MSINKDLYSSSIADSPSSVTYLVQKFLEMQITKRKKRGYITGRNSIPKKDDPTNGEWEVDDALVKSWLLNSLTDKLVVEQRNTFGIQ